MNRAVLRWLILVLLRLLLTAKNLAHAKGVLKQVWNACSSTSSRSRGDRQGESGFCLVVGKLHWEREVQERDTAFYKAQGDSTHTKCIDPILNGILPETDRPPLDALPRPVVPHHLSTTTHPSNPPT